MFEFDKDDQMMFEHVSDQEPRSELKPYDDGESYVRLSVSEYNELLRRADAAYNAITLRRCDYGHTRPIEAQIDKHWLYALVMDKLSQLYSAEDLAKYDLIRRADDLLLLDVTIARRSHPVESTKEAD